MRDLRAVEPMYRPAERPAPSKPRRRVVIRRERLGPLVWRSDTPVADWFAEWRPALLALAVRTLAIAIFAAAGWFLALALFSDTQDLRRARPSLGAGGCKSPCSPERGRDSGDSPLTNGARERRRR